MDITSSYAYYYAYYSREYSTLVVLIEYDDDDVIGLRDPTSFPDAPTRFFSGGVGLRVWAGWAGCPRRLLTKKLTKSYTRYPVVGASGHVARSL